MVAGRRRGGRRPEQAAPEPVHLPEPDEREAYRVLDFALRAGEVLLSGGVGAADVTATLVLLARACGLDRVVCEVTFTSITLTYVRASDVAPVTSVRLVQVRAPDHTRVTEVDNLVTDLVQQRVTPEQAMTRLEEIRRARHPYRRWAVTASRAALAAAIAVLLGGGALVTVAAFATTVVVDRIAGALGARGLPDFYANLLGAAFATTVAMGLIAAELDVRPSLVVASGIVLLLPGITLVGSVQDAISGFLLTASARAFEVFVLAAGIVAGVAGVLSVADRLGVSLAVNQPPETGLADLPAQFLAAGVAAAAAAAGNYAPRRTIPAAAVAGALGWGAFRGLDHLDLNPALSTGVAAVVLGLGAYVFAHRQRVPPIVLVAAGIIPLLPGLTIYRGMLFLASGDTGTGFLLLSQATSIGLALAAGVILGSFLAQPARRELQRVERRIGGPRMVGALRRRKA
ncbi:threonine/serine ThrE exporter family protein [Modestobacter roseus]|uniref:threonine/serine ThrE exporter family protein n=1 Tax=Modestobacter roseus TaxID=1181884 RepID=UPI001885D4F9|nr:threonine/serine exporter family protein [Modestobacter roseus]